MGGAPATTLIAAGDNQIPSAVSREFDAQGRTTTLYDGAESTTTVPPDGGTATETIIDVFGRTVERRSFTNAARTAHQATAYANGPGPTTPCGWASRPPARAMSTATPAPGADLERRRSADDHPQRRRRHPVYLPEGNELTVSASATRVGMRYYTHGPRPSPSATAPSPPCTAESFGPHRVDGLGAGSGPVGRTSSLGRLRSSPSSTARRW
ncbi:hypothetical protein [Streptomyces radicis]|uniref:hypothetical protein n=1 Tax=Streptomyces radicis TaxID=1750517 RepID=UPI0011C3A269|nr:hypothetical protein [Streptomyces radicis]